MLLLILHVPILTLCRSIQVNINRNSPQHIPVSATGVNMSLRLSTSSVTLEHRDLAPPTQGLQGNVCLYNPHTVPASFKWEMSEEAQKSLYITHPEGVVPPLNSLLCEFVAQGSFHCPPVLPLSLLVDGGQEQEVECAVHYGVPQCSFDQSNVLFGAVPLNLTTSKSIVLKNTGKQHAYYTVSTVTHTALIFQVTIIVKKLLVNVYMYIYVLGRGCTKQDSRVKNYYCRICIFAAQKFHANF